MIDYKILNKIILFTADVYIDKMREQGIELPKLLSDLKVKLVTYRHHHGFTKEESEIAMKLGNDPEFQKIIKAQISHLIFILTVIKLWVELVPKKERPLLNISDNKLSKGKALYAIHMLKEKQLNKESYEEKKEVIDISVSTAEKFMSYHIKVLTQLN